MGSKHISVGGEAAGAGGECDFWTDIEIPGYVNDTEFR